MTLVDEIGINQAIPAIAAQFSATIPAVQWVVVGYLLTVSVLLLPVGRISDMVGHRKVYLAGLAVFTIGAVLAGFSPVLMALVLSKVLQGVGAAMIQATSLPIITASFPAAERGRAIGGFVGVLALGAIIGPVVGGGVVTLLDWRFFFFLSVPIGLTAILVAFRVLGLATPTTRPDHAGTQSTRFDWVGAGLASVALTVFLLMMTQGNQLGWDSPTVVGGFVFVFALVIAFIAWEKRSQHPMLPLGLFKNPIFLIGQGVMFLTVLGNTTLFFLIPFYLQNVKGLSPVLSGLVLAAVPAAFMTTGPLIGALSDRWGWRRFVPLGLLAACAAMVLLSRVTPTSPLALVVGPLALMGFGLGFLFSPVQNAVYGAIEPGRHGVLTAFTNMARNTGSLSSIAIGAAVVTATMGSFGYEASMDAAKGAEQGVAEAFTIGMDRAFMAGAVAIFLGFVVSLLPTADWRTAVARKRKRQDS